MGLVAIGAHYTVASQLKHESLIMLLSEICNILVLVIVRLCRWSSQFLKSTTAVDSFLNSLNLHSLQHINLQPVFDSLSTHFYPYDIIDTILHQAYICAEYIEYGGICISKLDNIANPMISWEVYT